jgi:predicted transcriptional regulator
MRSYAQCPPKRVYQITQHEKASSAGNKQNYLTRVNGRKRPSISLSKKTATSWLVQRHEKRIKISLGAPCPIDHLG